MHHTTRAECQFGINEDHHVTMQKEENSSSSSEEEEGQKQEQEQEQEGKELAEEGEVEKEEEVCKFAHICTSFRCNTKGSCSKLRAHHVNMSCPPGEFGQPMGKECSIHAFDKLLRVVVGQASRLVHSAARQKHEMA